MVRTKRPMTAMSGALQCSITREIKIKLYGGRLQFKCPEKDIINIDGTDCIKVNSRTRAWIQAVCGVANVQLETDDDEKQWKHAYSLASTPGWKSLLDARYEHCQRNSQDDDDEESKRPEEKKSLFGESESPNKGWKIPRAVALKWRDEPELIDVHVGGGRTIRLERAARRSAIPVVALIAANIEDFILHLGKDLTLESLTPRSYGQNDEKGVYNKTVITNDREYHYKFKIGDAGRHVVLASDTSRSDGSDFEDTPDDALEDAPQDNNDVIDAGDIAPEVGI